MSNLGKEFAWMAVTIAATVVAAVGLVTGTWPLIIPAGLAIVIAARHWTR